MRKKKQKDRIRIGKRLLKARQEKGLTQSQMAKVLDITQALYSQYEKDLIDIPLSKLYKISQILEKPISYFFGEEIKEDNIAKAVTDRDKREIIEMVLTLSNGEKKIAKNLLKLIKSGIIDGQKTYEKIIQEIFDKIPITPDTEPLIRQVVLMVTNMEKEKLEGLLKLIK